jgi:hypothetical protein
MAITHGYSLECNPNDNPDHMLANLRKVGLP